MRKVTLTLMMFLGGFSLALAQSGASTTTPVKEVKGNQKVEVKKPTGESKEVKSVQMKKMETLQRKEEAVIEEKNTNQK